MTGEGPRGDLIVLVADLDIENVARGLLVRAKSLGIRPLRFDVERHPNRDNGCRTQAAAQLRPFRDGYGHALVIFDLHGSGSSTSREETQAEVEDQLASDGWRGRSKAIVIDPEVEAWVWTRSARLPETLGWRGDRAHLQGWLTRRGFWPEDRLKPPDLKEAMREVMREARARRSPDRFLRLVGETALQGCRDPAFGELRDTLRTWFLGGSAPAGGGER